MHPGNISILQYNYTLPTEKIAFKPLDQRDASKLLVYKDGNLTDAVFYNIDAYLPAGCLMVFNDTKVINARIRFHKSTGGIIEIFCLEPADKMNEYAMIMSKEHSVKWKCFIGGAAKWKETVLQKIISVNGDETILSARIIEKLNEAYIIEFSWEPSTVSFGEILKEAGDIPLPPYIRRDVAPDDKDRYQTIYARLEGSVAAPTAGLHFTETIFQKLQKKSISTLNVTLHVGAGTFKPVKTEKMNDHEMHAEWIDVSIDAIRDLALHSDNIIAVGTTSVRTLESLYWMGIKTIKDHSIKDLDLGQWDAYSMEDDDIPAKAALTSLIKWMEEHKLDRLFTTTQILIAPGYIFKMVKALVTNFHQPQSTLLLLVAAAVGKEWEMLYDHALQNDYRFLSYGDGNLIYISGKTMAEL